MIGNVPNVLLVLMLLAAFATDVSTMRIPNRLTFSFTMVGFVLHVILQGWEGLRFSTAGMATGFALLMLLYTIGATGAGDVKLFAAIGALAGPTFVLHCLLYSILFAGAIGLIVGLFHKAWHRQIARFFHRIAAILCLNQVKLLLHVNDHALLRFPFMYAVLPGAFAAWSELSSGW